MTGQCALQGKRHLQRVVALWRARCTSASCLSDAQHLKRRALSSHDHKKSPEGPHPNFTLLLLTPLLRLQRVFLLPHLLLCFSVGLSMEVPLHHSLSCLLLEMPHKNKTLSSNTLVVRGRLVVSLWFESSRSKFDSIDYLSIQMRFDISTNYRVIPGKSSNISHMPFYQALAFLTSQLCWNH